MISRLLIPARSKVGKWESGKVGFCPRALFLFLTFSLSHFLTFNSAGADVYRISALVTITNAPTTNGQTLVVNSSTRTWTNNTVINPAIYILTNSTINGSTTNLFLHLAQYRFVSSLNVTYAGADALRFQAAVNQPLSVTIGGSWASVVMSTQLVTTPFTVPVRVPLDVESPANAEEIANLTVRGLNDFATQRGWTNWHLRNPTFSGSFMFPDSLRLHQFSTKTNYDISTNDLVLVADVRTNTVTFTLPTAASSSNLVWLIKDLYGSARTNNITITNAGGDRIDDATSYVLAANYESAMIISRGGTNFSVLADTRRAVASVSLKSYLQFSGFDNATGALPTNTNDLTAVTFMRPVFLNGTDAAANYIEWHLIVPEDLDTSVALRAKLKFRLTNTDTGSHRYVLSMHSVADSASFTGTPANAVNLDFAGDASGASGDVESVGYTTLTGWAAALTAGQHWVIRLARDGDTSDTSTVDSNFGSLAIEYGAIQFQ